MLLRLSSAYSRLAIALASFLVALTLSYFSIRQALASYAAERDTLAGYERAVRLEPANPQNWYLLGHFWESNLENPDPQRANSAQPTKNSAKPLRPAALIFPPRRPILPRRPWPGVTGTSSCGGMSCRL